MALAVDGASDCAWAMAEARAVPVSETAVAAGLALRGGVGGSALHGEGDHRGRGDERGGAEDVNTAAGGGG